MSRSGRGKSIYKRVKKFADPMPIPIMVHGDKLSTELHGLSERIVNPRLARVRATIDTLKLSAAHSGSYSLSANQIGIPNAIFVMHKELFDKTSSTFLDKMWMHPNSYELQEKSPVPDFEADQI